MPPDIPGDFNSYNKRVMIAPLNWGLGHVSRCIPIIHALEEMGVGILLASDGEALHLLKAEFPHLPSVRLPSYHIKYYGNNMVLNIARQLPGILYAIRAEKWHTEKLVRQYGIQGIISDNRYGCFHRSTSNVIMTHQLNLRIPQKSLEWMANRALRISLASFDEVWVPDTASEPSLSGELSHPIDGLKNVHYIGLLSRAVHNTSEKEYDVAVVLSGPEPQRSNLEQMLLEQAMALPQKFIFVQGKTKTKEHHFLADHLELVSYLTSEALNEVLCASDVIICRSGYSSLMDLVVLGKPAVLIPTPGQTEQEYLAEECARQMWFQIQQQNNIDLKAALNSAKPPIHLAELKKHINVFHPFLESWINKL
ncbi:MAG: glycosyltransferase [Saprospiraceae bacterium]